MILSKLNMLLFTYDRNSYEYIVANYLIQNKDRINNIKMVDILNDTNVSKSTLSRFFKKLGYKSYADVQYLLTSEKTHDRIFKERLIDKQISKKFAEKKRIIVIGDSYSISPLLVYRQKFFEIGINLEVSLSLQTYGQVAEEYKFNKQEDLIILISLYKSDLDLTAEFFSGYLNLKHIVKEQNLDYFYIGKVATGNRESDDYFKIDDTDNFSDMIYQLCCFFEGVYNFYCQ